MFEISFKIDQKRYTKELNIVSTSELEEKIVQLAKIFKEKNINVDNNEIVVRRDNRVLFIKKLQKPETTPILKKVYLEGWEEEDFIEGICEGDWNGFEVPKVTIDQVEKFNQLQEKMVDTLDLDISETTTFDITEIGGETGSETIVTINTSDTDEIETCSKSVINGVEYYDVSAGLIWEEWHEPNND